MNEVVDAICSEASLQHTYLNESVETIYLGGGTPSLLSRDQLEKIFSAVHHHFNIIKDPEVTIETNPDDITEISLNDWKHLGVNRLSIGVQSFFEEDLQWMNRAHNAQQALQCIEMAQHSGLTNITIDLIYGTPQLTDEKWRKNIRQAIDLKISHLSCYALTVEEGTALHHRISKGKDIDVDTDKQARHFDILLEETHQAGYEHYEISNFALPGHRSQHNSNYWKGRPYIGLGPSAHSFNGETRQWNIANNALYVQSIKNGIVPAEVETLTEIQRFNEAIMIALRTSDGISLQDIDQRFSGRMRSHLQERSKKYISNDLMLLDNDHLRLTKDGKFLADGIAADLFL